MPAAVHAGVLPHRRQPREGQAAPSHHPGEFQELACKAFNHFKEQFVIVIPYTYCQIQQIAEFHGPLAFHCVFVIKKNIYGVLVHSPGSVNGEHI